MHETYVKVGNEASWVFAFMPVPALIVTCLQRRRQGKRPYVTWYHVGIVVFFFALAFLGVPFEWIVGGACMGGGAYMLTSKQFLPREVPRRIRPLFAVLALVFVGLGFAFVAIGRFGGERMTLSDSDVTFTFLGSDNTVPRKDLSVTAMRGMSWLNVRRWSTWTTFSRANSQPQNGPMFAGFSVYWGPHGLIRGDDLAMHFARWARVTPSLLTRRGKEYVHSTLLEFKAKP